jgi:hypothetical protein
MHHLVTRLEAPRSNHTRQGRAGPVSPRLCSSMSGSDDLDDAGNRQQHEGDDDHPEGNAQADE